MISLAPGVVPEPSRPASVLGFADRVLGALLGLLAPFVDDGYGRVRRTRGCSPQFPQVSGVESARRFGECFASLVVGLVQLNESAEDLFLRTWKLLVLGKGEKRSQVQRHRDQIAHAGRAPCPVDNPFAVFRAKRTRDLELLPCVQRTEPDRGGIDRSDSSLFAGCDHEAEGWQLNLQSLHLCCRTPSRLTVELVPAVEQQEDTRLCCSRSEVVVRDRSKRRSSQYRLEERASIRRPVSERDHDRCSVVRVKYCLSDLKQRCRLPHPGGRHKEQVAKRRDPSRES